MIQVFSQLLSAALGSVGFGLIFNLNRRYLPAAGVGGLLAWLAYLLAANTLHSVFLANLLAGFCAALYAEILARCCNAPSTPFFITAAIPLIPGMLDKNSIEVFANDGEQTMTAWIYTPQSADGITFAADGKATVTVEQFELNL